VVTNTLVSKHSIHVQAYSYSKRSDHVQLERRS
jgi:hypothetical protein